MLQSTFNFGKLVVFVKISELVEVTEEATDNALFHSEDLLCSINDGSPCNGDGLHGLDNTHRVDRKSGRKDDASRPTDRHHYHKCRRYRA